MPSSFHPGAFGLQEMQELLSWLHLSQRWCQLQIEVSWLHRRDPFFRGSLWVHVVALHYRLSQWLTFKLLGITCLVGKIKFKLLFHGPLAEWVTGVLESYFESSLIFKLRSRGTCVSGQQKICWKFPLSNLRFYGATQYPTDELQYLSNGMMLSAVWNASLQNFQLLL